MSLRLPTILDILLSVTETDLMSINLCSVRIGPRTRLRAFRTSLTEFETSSNMFAQRVNLSAASPPLCKMDDARIDEVWLAWIPHTQEAAEVCYTLPHYPTT